MSTQTETVVVAGQPASNFSEARMHLATCSDAEGLPDVRNASGPAWLRSREIAKEARAFEYHLAGLLPEMATPEEVRGGPSPRRAAVRMLERSRR